MCRHCCCFVHGKHQGEVDWHNMQVMDTYSEVIPPCFLSDHLGGAHRALKSWYSRLECFEADHLIVKSLGSIKKKVFAVISPSSDDHFLWVSL